jgi:hypothetical protein
MFFEPAAASGPSKTLSFWQNSKTFTLKAKMLCSMNRPLNGLMFYEPAFEYDTI